MKRIVLASFLILTGLAACSNDLNTIQQNGSSVIFRTFVGLQSRGAAASMDASANLQQDFGVFVYRNAIGAANDTTTSNTLYNEEVRFKTGNSFEYTNTIYWPSNNKLGFYAYSPYSSGSENGISGFFPANGSTQGSPGFQFTVNTNVNNQIDLLVAKTEGRNGGSVPLAFLHALSRIEIQAQTSGTNYRVAIQEVVFRGIYSTGTYSFVNMSQPWKNQSNETLFTAALLNNGSSIPGGSGNTAVVVTYNNNSNDYTQVTDPNNALYLLPQLLSSNAQMVITYNIYSALNNNLISNSSSETIIINLSDPDVTLSGLVEWGKNKRVIYKLNFAPQSTGVGSIINFEATVKDWDVENGIFS